MHGGRSHRPCSQRVGPRPAPTPSPGPLLRRPSPFVRRRPPARPPARCPARPQHIAFQACGDCQAARLASRMDVCLAMASETDAPLLRDAVAFAPHTLQGGMAQPDLVAFLVALQGQQVRSHALQGGGRQGGTHRDLHPVALPPGPCVPLRLRAKGAKGSDRRERGEAEVSSPPPAYVAICPSVATSSTCRPVLPCVPRAHMRAAPAPPYMPACLPARCGRAGAAAPRATAAAARGRANGPAAGPGPGRRGGRSGGGAPVLRLQGTAAGGAARHVADGVG